MPRRRGSWREGRRDNTCALERWQAEALADAATQCYPQLAAGAYILWISARRVGPGKPAARGLKWGVMLTRPGPRVGGICGTWHCLAGALALRLYRDDRPAATERVKGELAAHLPWPVPADWEDDDGR